MQKGDARMTERRIATGLTACGLGLLLAGCSSWSYSPPMTGNPVTEPLNLSGVRAQVPPSPQNFNQALTSDYASFATALHEQQDWNDADYFSRKGIAAAAGDRVPPEDNQNWLIPLEVPAGFRTELAQSRQRLVADLDGGGRERAPAVAARAQVSYDCWVERMEQDWRNALDGPCHHQLLAALDQLENRHTAAASQRDYVIYFNFDRAELVPDARRLVQQIAEQARQGGTTRIVPLGKADRAGSDAYNLDLSRRRAEAVRAALVQNGVAPDSIDEQWVGEREPPVPTPPGQREPRNRVVEVTLE
jgi:OmpA-OmpF porin, OOP family